MSEKHGLYIHIPFCVRKCPYCDFYSISDLSLKKDFITALVSEIQLRSDLRNRFDTIYFGGGTPSLIDPDDIEKILDLINNFFSITSDPEITIEINPGTVDKEYFSSIKAIGINRINLGIQSFQENKLKFLKRIHSADKAKKTIDQAIKAGFKNIGLDLIYGLPGENKQTWIADINAALDFSPSHLSCYMLTYEPGTKMYDDRQKGVITPLNEDVAADLFMVTSRHLTESHGFSHYEISNFASGKTRKSIHTTKSIHNQKYWSGIPYLGLGPSAHSFDTRTRSWNLKDVKKYIEQLKVGNLPVLDKEILSCEQKIVEMVMLGLRTDQGVNFKKFKNLTGKNFISCFQNVIERIESQSMGTIDREKFHLTLKGMLFLDSITALFADKIFKGEF